MSDEPKALKVGFVGIGNMGLPMAANIARKGWDLGIYDADAERRCKGAKELNCTAASSLTELGARSDVVILMLPDGNIARRVVLGDPEGGDHLLSGMAGGGVIIDMSSSAPVGTRELGAELASRDVSLLDAPVSGGVKGAVAGTLAILVGGRKTTAERFDSLLSAMGRRFFVGSLGSGHAAKVLNNYVSAAGLAAAAEALLVADRFGIDGDVLIEVLNASTGRNNSTENKFKQFILNNAYNSGFALDLMVKDLKLAMEVADSCSVRAVFGQQTLDIWLAAQAWAGSNADHTEFARYILQGSSNPEKPADKKSIGVAE